MLNVKKILEISKKLNLQAEEIFFLYGLYVRNENPEDKEFKALFSNYFVNFQFYNSKSDNPVPIMWLNMIERLTNEGYIENFNTKKDDSLNLSMLRVTDKFLNLLVLTEGSSYWFDNYLDLWRQYSPKHPELGYPYVIGTNYVSVFLPDKTNDKVNTIEKIENYFWKELCQNGQKYCTGELFAFTEKYLQTTGANTKISTFLLNYPYLKEMKNELVKS